MESQRPIVETPSYEELRGGGGKLKKPNKRNTANTPYSRPQQIPSPRHRWFSKLVDPAYRLISGGANYIFPSFFSKSNAVLDQNEETHCDELENENDDANNVVRRTSGEKLKGVVVDVENENDVRKHGEKFLHGGVDEIEKLIQEKDFSRDEINRLLEIIRSRAADDCNVGLEQKFSALGGQAVGYGVVSVELGKTYEQNPEDSDQAIHGISKLKENKRSSPLESAVLLEISRKPSEDEPGYFGRTTWETSTPLFQSTAGDLLQNEVGASPIDIAKAYMENRTLEFGSGSKSLISKDKGMLQQDDGLPPKPLIPFSSPKSSICWPGAMAQDQRIYKTPLSQRGRSGLRNFPKTPYSRTIGSKSRSKLQGDSDRHLMPPPHLAQSLTSSYGQVATSANVLDSGWGSVDPNHRIERKGSETPRGFSYFQSPVRNPPQEEITNAVEKGKTSGSSKLWSVQNKAQTSDQSVLTVPSHSSEVARKILEHLERNPPTPKDKSAEIKLATSWRKPQSSYETSSTALGGLDSIRESEGAVQQTNLKDNGGYSIFKASQDDANKATASASNNGSTSGVKFGGFSSSSHSNQTVPSMHSNKSQDSRQLSSTHQDVYNAVKDATGSELLGLRKKPPSSGTKPVLPAISIAKPGQRLAFPMDNNSGFTFPISASSTVSSEPPTPSIMPSSTATAGDQQDGNPTPSYNFGSKRSTPAIVFSFPSTSNVPTSKDSSDLKFKFGSDKSTRISFASIGKDSICY